MPDRKWVSACLAEATAGLDFQVPLAPSILVVWLLVGVLSGCQIERSPRPNRALPFTAASGLATEQPDAPASPPGQQKPDGRMPTQSVFGEPTAGPEPVDSGAPPVPPMPDASIEVPVLTDDLIPMVDAGKDQSTTCELEGLWAMRATVDVVWGGKRGGLADLTDAGRGMVITHLLGSIESIDAQGNFVGNVRVCGTALPPFYSSTLCESYQPTFPDWVWESDDMPVLPLTGSVECENPGCVLRFNPSTALLGVNLQQPLSPWPPASETNSIACRDGKGDECFPDHDANRRPGITVEMITDGIAPRAPYGACTAGYAYRAPPLREDIAAILNGVRRADRLLLGTRTTLGGVSVLWDCEHGGGGGIAQGYASRAIGCLVEPGTFDLPLGAPAGADEDCGEDYRSFIDANLPEYTILSAGEKPDPRLDVLDRATSVGPQFATVRIGGLGDEIDCAQARSADYD